MDGNVKDPKGQRGSSSGLGNAWPPLSLSGPAESSRAALQALVPPVPTSRGGGASMSKGSVLLPSAVAGAGTFVSPLMQLNK